MSRGRWVAVALVFVATLHSSCGEFREPAKKANLIPVKFGLRPHLSFAPLRIAQEEGYFAEEGLDLEIVDIWPADALVALPLGYLDAIGVPVFVGLFNAMEREESVRMVADKGHIGEGCSPYMIMARSDLFVDGDLTIDQMRGSRLEKRAGTIYDFIMEQFFVANDLGWEDFELIDWIPPHTSAAGFETGQLDFKIETEPNLTVLSEAGIARPWIPLSDVVPGLQFSAIVYGPRLIEEEPELGVRFMKAYLKGVRQYNEGATERNVEIVSEFTGLEPELVKKACWTPIDPDGTVDTNQIQRFVDWLRKDGLVGRDLTTDDWWTPRFAMEASKALSADER